MMPYFESSIAGAPHRPRRLGRTTPFVGHAANAVDELHSAHRTSHAACVKRGCGPRPIRLTPCTGLRCAAYLHAAVEVHHKSCGVELRESENRCLVVGSVARDKREA